MTATLEEIHNDPEIIDRAISRSERLDIPPHSPTPVRVLTVSGAAGAKAIS